MHFFRKKAVDPDIQKLCEAIAEYPIFQPPFSQPYRDAGQARSNYEFFLASREERQRHLLDLIGMFVGPDECNPIDLTQVSNWVHRLGSHLVGDDALDDLNCYFDFTPRWDGPFRRINVIFDLAVYAGNTVCALNKRCNWGFDVEVDDEDGSSYLRPCLYLTDSYVTKMRIDVFLFALDIVRAKRRFMAIGYKWGDEKRRIPADDNMRQDAFEKRLLYWSRDERPPGSRVYEREA